VRSRIASLILTAAVVSGSSAYLLENRSTAAVTPVAPFASSAAIWFQPQPPELTGHVGTADYLDLFRPGAQWQRVLAHIKVVGFYAGWLYSASDKVLRPIVSFLKAHHIGIEIESPALQALPTCGSGIEGYVPYRRHGLDLRRLTLTYLHKLRALGARVLYLKVDEPYYFGSAISAAALQQVSQPAGDKAPLVSCHFPVTEVARDVGQFARLVKTIYPAAEIGDVEPVSPYTYTASAVSVLEAWQDVYRSVTGAPFPFFFADVDLSYPQWPTLVQPLATGLHQRGIRFGIIYIGDPQDISDAEWTSQVVADFEEYQQQDGGRPDYVLFQSWQSRPRRSLPETDPTSFTGLIDTYETATEAQ
jgi:hypothetical protein